jgi:hypothetical protein
MAPRGAGRLDSTPVEWLDGSPGPCRTASGPFASARGPFCTPKRAKSGPAGTQDPPNRTKFGPAPCTTPTFRPFSAITDPKNFGKRKFPRIAHGYEVGQR